MDSRSDQELLREYSERGADSAFAELVRRHVDFLFSAAVRMTGERHLAEDVTQCVFVLLARNAAALTEHPVLSGWLHRTTRNVASKMVRTEVRRRAREEKAAIMIDLDQPDATWDAIASSLDTALEDLKGPEREALFLRFFERKSARQIAEALGTTEDAAQKRVSRAVERLREIFATRGVTVTVTGLVAAMAANSVQGAPASLAANISTAVLGKSVLTASTTAATKLVTMTTLQKSVVAVVLVATAATAVFEGTRATQFEQSLKLARQHQNTSSNQLQQITTERDRALQGLAALLDQRDHANTKSSETSRLRAEVDKLRDQLHRQNMTLTASDPTFAAAKALVERVETLRGRFANWPGKASPELQLLSEQDWLDEALKQPLDTDAACRSAMGKLRTRAKFQFGTLVNEALENFAKANNDQLPTDLSQLASYLSEPTNTLLTGYEIAKPGWVHPPQPNSPNAERAATWAIVERGAFASDGTQSRDEDSLLSDPEYDMHVVIYRGGSYGYGPASVAK
ncbi:MAG: hypothetical protein JWO95_1354 [Verrucomicrobiales bacterium]|nr:hypothetical protein [Verrucomicrobiales bacterium]